MGTITRDTYSDAHPELDEVRLYQLDDLQLPSVTTILKTRDEDKSNLYNWQDENDGEGDNPYHEHLFWYARHRGTLGHYNALINLDPSLEWTADENQSKWEIQYQTEPEVHDDPAREILYSVLKDQHAVESWGEFYDRHSPYKSAEYYQNELWQQCQRDLMWYEDTFRQMCQTLGITEDRAITVEKFLFDTEYGYAGQADLVLEYPNGDHVIADLKSKKGAYTKEKLQGAAYGKAVERDPDIPVESIDRTEVWCLHPTTGKHAIYCQDGDASPLHTDEYWRKDYEECWQEFRELTEQFHETVEADTDQ